VKPHNPQLLPRCPTTKSRRILLPANSLRATTWSEKHLFSPS
jgi:hypothetical protein